MTDLNMARTEFAAALNQIATERGIDPQQIIDSLKSALIAAYKKDYPEEYAKLIPEVEELETEELAEGEEGEERPEPEPNIDVTVNGDTGEFKIVVIEDGKQKDVTPPGFGRIAAQTAKQVVMQQVREAEKQSIIDEYRDKVGNLITAQVLRFDGKNVVLDIGRGQGVMPPEEQIRGEFYKLNSRIAVLIADIRETPKGEAVIASRADSRLVKELFAREVPEVGTDTVVIERIARDPGIRTKVAVKSTQEGVDPVGSCVGQKGVRVQAVINELNGERVDIIQYTEDDREFIAQALAPAENLDINLDDKKKVATVTVPEDQLSLAIGRGGQNVRLAAKLTGYNIKVIGGNVQTISVTGDEEYEIDLLDLDTKTRNKLVDAGILMLEQLLGQNIDRLQEIDGVGPKTIEEIKTKLAAYQEKEKEEEKEEEQGSQAEGEIPTPKDEETSSSETESDQEPQADSSEEASE